MDGKPLAGPTFKEQNGQLTFSAGKITYLLRASVSFFIKIKEEGRMEGRTEGRKGGRKEGGREGGREEEREKKRPKGKRSTSNS